MMSNLLVEMLEFETLQHNWRNLKDKMREYYNKEKDPKKVACWLKVIKVMNSMDGTFGGKK